jgi:RNA polymerase sigma-70 factor (ECF subfamily)
MSTPEADRIVTEVLGGRIEAYAGIVRLYRRDVWRVVAALLRDAQQTEELVQQVFVDAYAVLSRYETGRDFGAWIKSIARNLVREELRRRDREARRLQLYRNHLEARLRDDATDEQHAQRLSEAQAACRERLADTARQALDLRYGESRSHEEVAAALGRSVEAVRQLLFRVRVVLRDCIEHRLAGSG